MAWELIAHGLVWNVFYEFEDCVLAMNALADFMQTIGMGGELTCKPIIVEIV